MDQPLVFTFKDIVFIVATCLTIAGVFWALKLRVVKQETETNSRLEEMERRQVVLEKKVEGINDVKLELRTLVVQVGALNKTVTETLSALKDIVIASVEKRGGT